MFMGFFTPTEGAAIGAGGTLLLALSRRLVSWRALVQAMNETLRTSCMVMIIIAGAIVFGHFLAVTRIPSELASWLSGLPLPGWVIMIFIITFYLIAGCFVDALALVMLTVPVFYPVVVGLHYDPIWFAVIIVLVTQMGTITPPVGVCVYVVGGIERDVPLESVFKGSMPFLVGMILAALIVLAVPQIATWLPGLIRGS
jgi:C4-dicarboxylate transporter, DctM subunit